MKDSNIGCKTTRPAKLATDCLGSDPQTFRKNRLLHRLTWIRGEKVENVV